MKRAFCTIITFNYIPFAKTLFQSIKTFDHNVKAFALVVDNDICFEFEEFKVLNLLDLSDIVFTKEISKKYSSDINSLRWSLKSVLMIHLLQDKKFDQVFFVDSDLFFYSDFKFLYNELGQNSFLLSPHWYCMDPNNSKVDLYRLMTDGLYNAGFLGATSRGLSTLYWWAKMCLHSCCIDYQRGLFVDQAYLNVFPLRNPDSKIINHRGCNVASWNRIENVRSLSSDGKLYLNEVYPLVFIHFSDIPRLIQHDELLKPFLEKYEVELKRNGFEGSLISPAKEFIQRQKLKKLTYIERIVRKVLGKKKFSKFKGWDK